ncbi:MAG: response regulator transcription factor [Alphaproteobacteria bacterium]|nr:response regulator transcription factor [Alphaproteobacteria bacterium]
MKFLIADDHELFLQGLEFVLHKEFPQAEIVLASSYTSVFEVLEKQNDFDLILTDLAMPGANWFEAISKIHSICVETPVIIISAVFDKEILQKTFDLGVAGYVSKSFPNNLIISAINLVLAGGMYIPPDILQMSKSISSETVHELIKDLDENKNDVKNARNYGVTPRQREVLCCMAEGMSNKQIAYKLGLSEGTVKVHVTLLMRALDVNNRTSAVLKAGELGLLKQRGENEGAE